MHSIVLDYERRQDGSGSSRSQWCVLEDLSSSSRCPKDKELCPWPCPWSQVFGLSFGFEVKSLAIIVNKFRFIITDSLSREPKKC